MEKDKIYKAVQFSADILKEALRTFNSLMPEEVNNVVAIRKVAVPDDETWIFDSDEEFFAKCRKSPRRASLSLYCRRDTNPVIAKFYYAEPAYPSLASTTHVQVQLPTAPEIEQVFEIFEKNLEASLVPAPPVPTPAPIKPVIFIGHGRSNSWRDLKDHLTDKQGYTVAAYETGERAGHTIRDILQELLTRSSFALLVLTAEDETSSGDVRARQNVIHELGLFQGKLGFPRAIAIVEKGVELLSNLDGVQQLRFSEGNVAEVYGDVIATLRREFGDAR
jgi:predicted nucleotide-binding protein